MAKGFFSKMAELYNKGGEEPFTRAISAGLMRSGWATLGVGVAEALGAGPEVAQSIGAIGFDITNAMSERWWKHEYDIWREKAFNPVKAQMDQFVAVFQKGVTPVPIKVGKNKKTVPGIVVTNPNGTKEEIPLTDPRATQVMSNYAGMAMNGINQGILVLLDSGNMYPNNPLISRTISQIAALYKQTVDDTLGVNKAGMEMGRYASEMQSGAVDRAYKQEQILGERQERGLKQAEEARKASDQAYKEKARIPAEQAQGLAIRKLEAEIGKAEEEGKVFGLPADSSPTKIVSTISSVRTKDQETAYKAEQGKALVRLNATSVDDLTTLSQEEKDQGITTAQKLREYDFLTNNSYYSNAIGAVKGVDDPFIIDQMLSKTPARRYSFIGALADRFHVPDDEAMVALKQSNMNLEEARKILRGQGRKEEKTLRERRTEVNKLKRQVQKLENQRDEAKAELREMQRRRVSRPLENLEESRKELSYLKEKHQRAERLYREKKRALDKAETELKRLEREDRLSRDIKKYEVQ